MEHKENISSLNVQNRDIKFDILRFIGLMCIILAHVNPPKLLFQLRNFDVPLMVMISGAVYSFSSGSKQVYKKYLLKRLNRFITPTWIFLTIFFSLSLLFSLATKSMFPYRLKTIITSFMLLDGIGYVWIVRVFLLTALISPLFLWISRQSKSDFKYLMIIALIYVSYELIYKIFAFTNNKAISFILNNIIYLILPYGCLTALGIRLPKIKKKNLIYMTIVFGIIFFVLLFANKFAQTQEFKYPPTLYYNSYAIFVSLFLYLMCNVSQFSKLFNNNIVKFISASSFWIYLWHIFYLSCWQYVSKVLPLFMRNFFFEFIVVLTIACVTTLVQKNIVRNLVLKLSCKKRLVAFFQMLS